MATIEGAGYKETPPKGVMADVTFGHRESLVAADEPGAADTRKIVKIPEGVKILGGVLASADLDSNGTPTITMYSRVTDGTTTKDLVANSGSASTIGQAGGVADADQQAAIGFVTDTADYYLEVVFPAAPATWQDGDLAAFVTYTPILNNGA